MNTEKQQPLITIRGIVCHSGWDENAEVSQVSIFTFDDDEYVVAPDSHEEFLAHQTGVEIMARGYLVPDPDGRKVIRVERLTVFGSMAGDYSERDEDFMGVSLAHPSLDEWTQGRERFRQR